MTPEELRLYFAELRARIEQLRRAYADINKRLNKLS